MKKFIKLVLSFVLSLSVICPTVSISIGAIELADTTQDGIISALKSTECIKDKIGLEDVDFSKLTVGRPIQTYDYTETGLINNSEFYPLKQNGTLVAWAIKFGEIDEAYYQISTALIDEVNNIIVSTTEFAIIYGYSNSYLYDGNRLYVLNDILLKNETRIDIDIENNTLESELVKLENISDSTFLGYTHSKERLSSYISCRVDVVSQNPPSNMCWAATIACIVNYRNNTNLTARTVASAYWNTDTYSEYNIGLPIGEEVDVLQMYGLSYTHRNTVPSTAVITNNIEMDFPLFASFRHSNGSHAVVLYGIDFMNSTIYLMDPEYGICTAMYDFKSANTYKYTSGYSGVTLTFNNATCRTWSS